MIIFIHLVNFINIILFMLVVLLTLSFESQSVNATSRYIHQGLTMGHKKWFVMLDKANSLASQAKLNANSVYDANCAHRWHHKLVLS